MGESFGIDFSAVNSARGGIEELTHSWQEATKGELLGGPSPHGNSWWSDFLRCKRRFYLAHVKNLKTTTLEMPLEVGGLFHECVALFFRGAQTGGAKGANEAAAGWVAELLDRTAKITPVVTMEARKLWLAWFSQYGPDGYSPITRKVFGVELLLSTERLADRWTFPYSARLDAVLWGSIGPQIRELKTARRLSADLLHGYEMNGQFLGQAYLWNLLQEPSTGKLQSFEVDLVIKTQNPQLQTVTVEIPRKLVVEWAKSMQSHYVDMLRCHQTGKWPQNHNACVSWSYNALENRQCHFHGYCTSLGKDMAGLRKKARGEW